MVPVGGGRGGGGDGARPGLVDQHGPVLAEERGDLARLVEVAGGDAVLQARGQAGEVVAGEQQGAAGGDGVEQAAQCRVVRPARKREVVDGHEVERAGRGRRDGQVGARERHAVRDVRGRGGGAFQGRRGDVHRGDPPAVPGQPQRVGALAAADVECLPRRHAGDLGDEHLVGCAAEQLLTAAVLLVPVLGVHGCSSSWADGGAATARGAADDRRAVRATPSDANVPPAPRGRQSSLPKPQNAGHSALMNDEDDAVLAAVGPRLRELRRRSGATLTALSGTTGIPVSTLSRLESGHRRPGLELLLPLARAYGMPLDELVGAPAGADPRVRPRPVTHHGMTVVPLTPRKPGGLQAFKQILPAGPADREPDPRSHEGYHWLYVLDGRLRLVLGDQDLVLTAGEVAEFDTHLPHWFGNADARPVEFLSILGPQGERVHTRARYRPA